MTPAGIAADSVTRAVASVFRHPEFRRSLRRTLAEEILDWFDSLFRSIGSAMDSHPLLRWLILAAALTVAGLIAARAVYARQMETATPQRWREGPGRHAFADPWASAQSAALAGDYVDAAHALYAAVLQALSGSDRVIIDSAKTVGDYTRELRRLSSRSLPLYRDFARAYEPVVWGSRDCDRARFDLLSGIASRLAGRNT